MEEENVAIRLKLFMDYLQVTNSQFADQCGIARPSLSQLLNGRNKKISDVLVKQIHDQFPRLSILWLMFGEGDMLMPLEANSALVSDTSKFMDDDADDEEYGKEIELTRPQNMAKTVYSSVFSADSNSTKKEGEIEKNAKNPRKVVSITVFYDDNSYEIFHPSRKI